MIKIRLSRRGVRNNPFYRIVAIDERSKKSAEPLEILGYWHPSSHQIKIEKEKLNSWVKKGAQITAAVDKLLNTK